jgi:hypothetical protein
MMPDDRSEECRRLATEWLAVARQNPDPKVRVLLVEMAQTWLDRADLPDRQGDDRYRVIQDTIGKQLRTLHRLRNDLSPHLLALLGELNDRADDRED